MVQGSVGFAGATFRSALLAGVGLLALCVSAQAADIEAKSRIEAVTVYPDGAIVSRLAEVELPAGESLLVFRGLPGGIDPASLRVEGKGSGAMVLGSVEARLVAVDPARLASASEAEMKALRATRDKLGAVLNAHEGRKAMIDRFAQSGPERPGNGASLDVAQWAGAWEAVGQALARVNEDIRLAREEVGTVEARIKALELADSTRRSRLQPEREFTVALSAAQPLKGQLTLSYRITGAGWRPAYDAALTTGEAGKAGTMTLTRRAIVTQRTGEDWTDVALTLSTVRAARGTAAPDIQPQRVGFFEPVVMSMSAERMRAAEMADGAAKRAGAAPAASSVQAAPPPAAPVTMAMREATLETNGFQASYRLTGALSVPKDGSEKSFVVQSRTLQPELLIRAAPALDPTAYLEAAFANAEEAPLLAGDVRLVRDGAYIGRGRLGFTAPGDRVTLGFGADDQVKVARVPVRRRETEPSLLGSTKSDTREFKTTVRNLHDFAIRAVVIDQMPYSKSANLTVEPLAGMTPPTEKIVQDKRGVIGWTQDLKPGEEKEIRFGYRLRWPSDREVIFQTTPMPR